MTVLPLADGGFPEPNFGCGFGDVPCYINEGTARVAVGAIAGMGDFTADIIVNAFDKSITNDEWGVAFGQWGMWAGVMLVFVAIVMLYQMAMGALMQNRRRIGTAALGGMFSVPIAALTVMLMARIVAVVDESSQKVIESIQGGVIGAALVKTMGLNADASQFNEDSIVHSQVTDAIAAKSIATMIPALILLVLMMLGGALLDMAMSFREFGLLILAALAPVALMLIGQGKLSAWAEKWFTLVAGLLLMKPLVVGIMAISISINSEVNGRTFSELLVAVLVMFACAFAPFWVVKLADITGGEVGAALAGRPSMRGGMSRMNAVTNNRVVQATGSGMKRAGGAVSRGTRALMSGMRRK